MDVLPGLVVLRFVNGVVVDHPFVDGVPAPWWASTLEPDSGDSSGWRRTLWPSGPGGRGWVPGVLHFGDVIEFGSYADPRWRWFGWFTHRVDDALLVTGPFGLPSDAWSDAAPARGEIVERAMADYRVLRLRHAAGDTVTPASER
jgi:hypothetical protein